MSIFITEDDTQLYYNDSGNGQPIVFSHGWPLSADAFEDQMFFLASHGYRCIAQDGRGHGRSSQPWHENDMDTYAEDLAQLVPAVDLRNVVYVGHSTGGGKKMDVPTLIPHRDDIRSCPSAIPPCSPSSARRTRS